jgi:uncharacterized protein (TIGR02453 family)
MMAQKPSGSVAFAGFEPAALQFLADLAANNERAWFKPRKTEYERLLKVPMAALCVALADRFSTLRLPLEADPERSPFRIHRDVRFSADKSPYKTHAAAQFPWIDSPGDELRAPGTVGAYFHLEPGNVFVGGGMWRPEKERLAAFRQLVDDDPSAVFRAIEDDRFVDVFDSVEGDSLTRNPRGYPPGHPYGELLRLKNVLFSRRLADRDVFSPSLPDIIARDLDAARPVLSLLDRLVPNIRTAV